MRAQLTMQLQAGEVRSLRVTSTVARPKGSTPLTVSKQSSPCTAPASLRDASISSISHPRPFDLRGMFQQAPAHWNSGIGPDPSHHDCHCHFSTYPPSTAIGFPSNTQDTPDTHDTGTAQRYLPSAVRLPARRHGRASMRCLAAQGCSNQIVNRSYAPSYFPLAGFRSSFDPCRGGADQQISLILPYAVAARWSATQPDCAAFICRKEKLHLCVSGAVAGSQP